MVNKLETAPVKTLDKQDRCCHYWQVESPNVCGAEKEFENYGLDY